MKYAVHLGLWLIAGAVGYFAYFAIIPHVTDGRLLQVVWAACIALSLGVGMLGTLASAKLAPLSDSERDDVRLAVGWAVASAAGWYVWVLVGGAFSGVVTVMIALSIHRDALFRFLICAGAALFGARLGLEFPEAWNNLFVGAAYCGGLAAVFLAGALLVTGASRKTILPATLVTVGWCFAWAIAYYGKNEVGMPSLAGYGTNSLELLIAFVIGGAITPFAASIPKRAIAWGIGSLIAAAVGIVLDLLISSLSGNPKANLFDGSPEYLDVGQTIGMAVGAVYAYRQLKRG